MVLKTIEGIVGTAAIKGRSCAESGHATRKRQFEHLVTTGMIEGKRNRDRVKLISSGLAAWLWKSTAELLQDTCDRGKWEVIIAHALNRHSTRR